MAKANSRTSASDLTAVPSAASARPFFGAIDILIVPAGGRFAFEGSIARDHAAAIWAWAVRDLAPDLFAQAAYDRIEDVAHDLQRRMRNTLSAAQSDATAMRRLKAQLVSDECIADLGRVAEALKFLPLMDKAEAFGRVLNATQDEMSMAAALRAMPLGDANVMAMVMHAAIGQITTPARVTATAVRLAGDSGEMALFRGGFGPLIEAILAHAQAQVTGQDFAAGTFADVDLMCRTIDRFHRLMRAVHAHLALTRGSRWSIIVTDLTRTLSEILEPRLKDVVPDIAQSLRVPRDNADRADPDRLLAALNGLYLLSAVRTAKDSLALNVLCDQAWTQTGEVLELQLGRNLDLYRDNPSNAGALTRLDGGIRIAAVRFGQEHADVLVRARDAVARRARG
jgi:hypothetical protein